MAGDQFFFRSGVLPRGPLSPAPRLTPARTARLHRISGTPVRRMEAMCLSPRSRTRSQSRTSGTVRAPTQVAATTWRTGRTSRRAQHQTFSSACRAAVPQARSFLRCAGKAVVRVDPLYRPAPILRVLPEFMLLRLSRLIVGRNACVNGYSRWCLAFFHSVASTAEDVRSGCRILASSAARAARKADISQPKSRLDTPIVYFC